MLFLYILNLLPGTDILPIVFQTVSIYDISISEFIFMMPSDVSLSVISDQLLFASDPTLYEHTAKNNDL